MPGLSGSTPAGVACIHFLRHPMANFVTTAQWLLPFCIKHIVKQTHPLLNGPQSRACLLQEDLCSPAFPQSCPHLTHPPSAYLHH
uniref:Uncharacterized protein n=1 Tax=Marmota marmota marmota TaxID=9994 RepID=A0A8C6A4R5_MARMA